MTPAELLAQHTPQVRATALALAALIHETVAGMQERAYPGWHGIGFRHPHAGYVCGIFPQSNAVRLLFEHGSELSDPSGVLAGDGTQTRYVELAAGAEPPAAAIRQCLLEAVALRDNPGSLAH